MSKPLLVLVPGIKGDPSRFDSLKEYLKKNTRFSDALWLDFEYITPFWSNKDMGQLSDQLAHKIDNYYADNKDEISEIILVGHSMGTTVLRRAYLDASGFGKPDVFSSNWVKKVKRIVLMGAIGRGVIIDNFSFWERSVYKVAIFFAKLFGFGKMRLALLSGSSFITKLRLDWIKFNREVEDQPLLYHLLGEKDRVVKPEDVIDLEQFPTCSAIGVPGVGHRQIIYPSEETNVPLRRVFTEFPETAREVDLDHSVRKVIFLLHGIRDSRDCFKRIDELIKDQSENVKVITPTYGYLSARGFISTRYRNSFVPWFVDEFAQYYAQYPKATFYFAGHSNGTYILGEALKRISSITFEKIYLAASVLPFKYDWRGKVKTTNQIKIIRSDMGTEDWPVSVLCRVLNKFGVKSVGTGGADGFEWGDSGHVKYKTFNGGHSSMLSNDNAQSIVDYLLNDSAVEQEEDVLQKPNKLFVLFKKFGDLLLPIILLLVLFALVKLLLLIAAPYSYLAIVASVWLIWLILDRF